MILTLASRPINIMFTKYFGEYKESQAEQFKLEQIEEVLSEQNVGINFESHICQEVQDM
jgi:signal recognition particle GTPase